MKNAFRLSNRSGKLVRLPVVAILLDTEHFVTAVALEKDFKQILQFLEAKMDFFSYQTFLAQTLRRYGPNRELTDRFLLSKPMHGYYRAASAPFRDN
jgi:hypothetical protein